MRVITIVLLIFVTEYCGEIELFFLESSKENQILFDWRNRKLRSMQVFHRLRGEGPWNNECYFKPVVIIIVQREFLRSFI